MRVLRYNSALLNNFIIDKKIQLVGNYDDNITSKTRIKGKCNGLACDKMFDRCFKLFYQDKNFYCEPCTKANSLAKTLASKIANLDIKKSIFITHPHLQAEWDGDIEDLKKLTAGSNKRGKWKCLKNSKCHVWETMIAKRTGEKTGCPYCSGHRVCPCEECGTSLYYTHPHLRKFWYGDIEDMKKVSHGSEVMGNWICDENSDHTWLASIYNVSSLESRCPYCNGGTNKVMEEDSVYHDKRLRDLWDGDIDEMKKFCKNSQTPKKWRCIDFPCHVWEALIKDMFSGQGCPFCSKPQKRICDCGECESNSVYVTHPHLIDEIVGDPNVLKSVTPGSGQSFHFKCHTCSNIWETMITLRTKGHGCPSCRNKTEVKVSSFLHTHYTDVIHNSRITFVWSINDKTGSQLKFDILLKDKQILIEIDGIQHFRYVAYYKNDVIENKRRDVLKMLQATKNGYSVIRLYQEDVYRDSYDWKSWLVQKIIMCEDNQPSVYFPDRNEYDEHKVLLTGKKT